ncbi:DoxX family protein [Aliiroseovarius sp. 2305UL8-7]|uniref:DoxX family protein n=1 Tax=Aliiroseovarius conchicola TaxID=3121637 RepID=UPI0035288E6C
MSKLNIKSASTWGLTGLLAAVFVAAGTSKILGVEQTVLPFERMEIPSMAILVGLLEIAGAIGLFIPRLRFLAALGLSATMVGAAGYHLTLDPEQAVVPALVLLVLTGLLTWIRRPQSTLAAI